MVEGVGTQVVIRLNSGVKDLYGTRSVVRCDTYKLWGPLKYTFT